MRAPTIAIDTWHNEIAVTRDHPAPLRVRDRVEEVTRRAQAELGQAFDGYLDRHDGEIILIRRVDLALDIDVACPRADAARARARRLTRELVDKIESRRSGVLRFPSRAAYRAQYIADLAAGNALNR